MNRLAAALAWIIVAPGLAACGGGGGDGRLEFAGFSTLGPGDRVTIEGEARTATYRADALRSQVTLDAISSPTNATLNLGIGEDGALDSARIGSATAPVAFDTGRGDTIEALGGALVATSRNGQQVAVLADPVANRFEYQTFGVWLTGVGAAQGTLGAGSFGSRTTANSVPRSGTATYEGGSTGVYAGPAGFAHATRSDVEAEVDFDTRRIALDSRRTVQTEILTGREHENRLLDFSMVGRVTGAGFGGRVEAPIGMTGDLTGGFHGPNAEEMGGTFGMTGRGGSYVGAFGGKR